MWLCEKPVLVPQNSTVNEVNYHLLRAIPTKSHIYKSIDAFVDQDEMIDYPTELLNLLEPPGLSPHRLD